MAEPDPSQFPPSHERENPPADDVPTSGQVPSESRPAAPTPPPDTPPLATPPVSTPAPVADPTGDGVRTPVSRLRVNKDANLRHVGLGAQRRKVDINTAEGAQALYHDVIIGQSAPITPQQRAFADIEDVRGVAASTDDSDRLELINSIVIGTAVMDTRHLDTKWKSETQLAQRALNFEHVQKLMESFESKGIKRVEADKRLYVSMTMADLKAACARCDDDDDDDDEMESAHFNEVRSVLNLAKQTDMGMIAKLPLPILAGGARMRCTVEAGQHRIVAMDMYTKATYEDAATVGLEDMADPNHGIRDKAIKYYGWTVQIVDSDKLKDPKYRRALAALRGNQEDVHMPDAEGLVFFQGISYFQACSPEEQVMYQRDFKQFARHFLGVNKDSVYRLQKAFANPRVRETLAALTSTRWGQDLYTERKVEVFADLRNSAMAIEVINTANENINACLEPLRVGHQRTTTLVNASKNVSITELTALRSCWGPDKSDLKKPRLTTLFFPNELDSSEDFSKGLPKMRWDTHVALPSHLMSDNGKTARANRMYRRPYFLSFLNNEQYQAVYEGLLKSPSPFYSEQPTRQANHVFFPTFKWFTAFTGVHFPAACVVQRLHWFCVAPQQYRQIASVGTPNLKLTKLNSADFDMGLAFKDDYVAYAKKVAVHREVKQQQRSESDSETDSSDEEVSSARVQEGILNPQGLLSVRKAVSKAESEFDLYVTWLYNRVAGHHPDVTLDAWEKACKLLPAFWYDKSTDFTMQFYRQILALKPLHETFEQVLFRNLKVTKMFSGIAQPLAWPEIKKKGNKGLNFFKLTLEVPFDSAKQVVEFVNKQPIFANLDPDERKDIVKEMSGPIDVLVTSLAMYRAWRLIDLHDQHETQYRRRKAIQTGEEWDQILKWTDPEPYKTATHLKSFHENLRQRDILAQGLERLKRYNVEGHEDLTFDKLIQATDRQVKRWLPHFGNAEYSTRDEDGDPIKTSGSMFEFARYDTIYAWLSNKCEFSYDTGLAEGWFAEQDDKKQKNAKKNAKAKASKATGGLLASSTSKPPKKAAAQKPNARKPNAKKPSVNKPDTDKKRKRTIKNLSAEIVAQSDDESDDDDGPPPTKRPRKDNSRGKNLDGTTAIIDDDMDVDDEDDESPVPEVFHVTDSEDSEDDSDEETEELEEVTKLRTADWTLDANGQLPPSTTNLLGAAMAIDSLNDSAWDEARALPAAKRGNHTKKQVKVRRQEVKDFLDKHNLKTTWDPLQGVPDNLEYVSEAAANKAKKKAAAPAQPAPKRQKASAKRTKKTA